MTTKRRNNLLLTIVTCCALLILPLIGVAIGFGVCGNAGAMGCMTWIIVMLVAAGTLCAINVRREGRA